MPDGRVVANDPWGDANGPNWGEYPNGDTVVYTVHLTPIHTHARVLSLVPILWLLVGYSGNC
jgi:hypothetical protein